MGGGPVKFYPFKNGGGGGDQGLAMLNGGWVGVGGTASLYVVLTWNALKS